MAHTEQLDRLMRLIEQPGCEADGVGLRIARTAADITKTIIERRYWRYFRDPGSRQQLTEPRALSFSPYKLIFYSEIPEFSLFTISLFTKRARFHYHPSHTIYKQLGESLGIDCGASYEVFESRGSKDERERAKKLLQASSKPAIGLSISTIYLLNANGRVVKVSLMPQELAKNRPIVARLPGAADDHEVCVRSKLQFGELYSVRRDLQLILKNI